jgi:maleylacetate reductase
MAHAVESLYGPDSSPIISLMATEGVRALVSSIPDIVANPVDLDARTRALYGAWLCGACLGATTMSLHHKLCHNLGGMLDLPHAPTHAVVLPYALAYNQSAARAALSKALGDQPDPANMLWQLAGKWGAPRSLRRRAGGPAKDCRCHLGLALRQSEACHRGRTHLTARISLGR